MYLLDTCVVSEAWRGTLPAVKWLQSAQSDTLLVSVVTVGEIMKGAMMKPRADPPAAASLPLWLDELRFVHVARLLPIDDAVANTWRRLIAERTRPVADGLIAATAKVHNKVLVIRNVADFDGTGVDIIDPWALMRQWLAAWLDKPGAPKNVAAMAVLFPSRPGTFLLRHSPACPGHPPRHKCLN
jgi:toxin FitB